MGELTQYIQCDVELNVSAPTQKVSASWTANALRNIADRLEREEFNDGHHEITDNSGKLVGTVYFDFSEGYHISED